MDKNQSIGLILISVLLISYFYFFSPEPSENQVVDEQNTELPNQPISQKEPITPDSTPVIQNDSTISNKLINEYGKYAGLITNNNSSFQIETQDLKIKLNSLGGVIEQVELKNYKTYYGEPLILFKKDNYNEEIIIDNEGKKLNINDLSFNSSIQNDVSITNEDSPLDVVFKAQVSENVFVVKKYSIYPTDFVIGFELESNGISNEAKLQITDFSAHFEKDLKQSRIKSTINCYSSENDLVSLSEASTDLETETVSKANWFAHKNKFFLKTWISKDKPFLNTTIESSIDEKDTLVVKKFVTNATIGLQGKNQYLFYFGPNKYEYLSNIGFDMYRNVYLGWPVIRHVNQWIIMPVFNFLEGWFSNYGVVIFIMVLLIKLVLFPFTYKSYVGFAKMRVLKPELDALKEKIGKDPAKMQQEQMKVYQKFGVNPLSGCIPMLFQMPILFALFQLFPNIIELRGKSFLWAEDLSTYDAFLTWDYHIIGLGNHLSLFTVLMTVSTLVYTHFNQQMQPPTQPGQPNMKFMMYLMPLIFFFMLNDFPSGLNYYYFLSNLITITQTLAIRGMINEQEIHAKMVEYSEKNIDNKKVTFQDKLEKMMKSQQKPKK